MKNTFQTRPSIETTFACATEKNVATAETNTNETIYDTAREHDVSKIAAPMPTNLLINGETITLNRDVRRNSPTEILIPENFPKLENMTVMNAGRTLTDSTERPITSVLENRTNDHGTINARTTKEERRTRDHSLIAVPPKP